MVRLLVEGNEAVVRTARTIFPAVDKASDEPTADLLTQRMQVHEKNAWMLRSLLENVASGCDLRAAGDVRRSNARCSLEFPRLLHVRESSQIVTGPSLTSATCIIAPNTPVGTGLPSSVESSATNASNAGRATSGRAAAAYDGRLPLRVDAYSVNCDTARTSPPTSCTERFITPASSSKTRSCTILRASQSRSSAVSSSVDAGEHEQTRADRAGHGAVDR